MQTSAWDLCVKIIEIFSLSHTQTMEPKWKNEAKRRREREGKVELSNV